MNQSFGKNSSRYFYSRNHQLMHQNDNRQFLLLNCFPTISVKRESLTQVDKSAFLIAKYVLALYCDVSRVLLPFYLADKKLYSQVYYKQLSVGGWMLYLLTIVEES